MGKELKGKKIMATKKELIESTEFDAAIAEGAEIKKNAAIAYKQQHKANYARFYETMLNNREDIKKILDTKKKNRSDADKKALVEFKTYVNKSYSQVRDFLIPEVVEDGKQTKIEKLVDKIAIAFDLLEYIGSDVLSKEFKKKNITLSSQKSWPESFNNEDVKKNVKDIFDCAVSLKTKAKADNDKINDDIYLSKVPIDLQFDKKMNNAGLKPGDFRKLVDMKAKLLMAKTEEAKEKVEEKIEKAASDKQFEVARAELVRDKLTKIQ